MAKPVLAELRIPAAFAVVYVVWGSTYLGIRIAVHDLPPGLMAGVRFIVAGLLLGIPAMALGQRIPRRGRTWRHAAVMGLLLIAIGNGVVTWAEQWVPSNQAALLIATSALWMAWFGTFGPRGVPLDNRVRLGLATGFAGVALILWPTQGISWQFFWAQIAILGSPLAWSLGSIYGRNADLDVPPLMFAAMQMLIGGVVLTVIGLLAGELPRWSWTPRGIGALIYLTLFGSCLAYGTYIWLIHHTTPARLGTIAYVNPAVAAFLGWWWLDETLSAVQLAGVAVIICGVFLVTASPARR